MRRPSSTPICAARCKAFRGHRSVGQCTCHGCDPRSRPGRAFPRRAAHPGELRHRLLQCRRQPTTIPMNNGQAEGGLDAAKAANARWKQLLDEYEDPGLDPAMDEALTGSSSRSARPCCRTRATTDGVLRTADQQRSHHNCTIPGGRNACRVVFFCQQRNLSVGFVQASQNKSCLLTLKRVTREKS